MRWRAGCGIVVGLLLLFTVRVVAEEWRAEAARDALGQAGYGEYVTAGTFTPRCGWFDSTTEFIAQGGSRHDAAGYVCTSFFHWPEIHELPAGDQSITLDWEPRE